MANTIASSYECAGVEGYPAEVEVEHVHHVKGIWMKVGCVEKKGVIVDYDDIKQVVNKLQCHHDSHVLVYHTLGQNVDRKDIEKAQNIFEIILESNTSNEADNTLNSINNKISEFHQDAVEKIETKPKMKIEKCVEVASDNRALVFGCEVVAPVHNILVDTEDEGDI